MPITIGDTEDIQFLTASVADSYYINASGDTMNGVLNMNRNKLTGLPTPSDPTDAVNKGFIDSCFTLGNQKLKMHYPIDMQLKKIINVNYPIEKNDVATKEYVDTLSKVYGFQYTVTPQPSQTYNIEVIAPGDVDPKRIMMVISRPFLRDITRIQTSSGGTTAKAVFKLKFKEPVNQRIAITGLIYILNSEMISISDEANEISLL